MRRCCRWAGGTSSDGYGAVDYRAGNGRAIAAIRKTLSAWANSPGGREIRAKGAHYNGPCDWLLQHGREMLPGEGTWTQQERAFIDVLVQGARFQKGECYADSQWALKSSLALSARDICFRYCEGYFLALGYENPVAHAWCLLNGRVWDPLLTLPESAGRRFAYWGREFLTKYLLESLEGKVVRPGYGLLCNPRRNYPVLYRDISEVSPAA